MMFFTKSKSSTRNRKIGFGFFKGRSKTEIIKRPGKGVEIRPAVRKPQVQPQESHEEQKRDEVAQEPSQEDTYVQKAIVFED